MASKRAYGSGSKREVRPGVWELRMSGRSQRFAGTAKEAEKALGRFAAMSSTRSVAGSATLQQLLEQWQGTRKLEQSTADRYDAALKRLPDAMRRKQLAKLTLRDFDLLYADLVAQGVSAQEVRKVHVAVSSALTQAVRWRLIDHHPARGAQLPKVQTRRVRVPSADEIARLRAELHDDLQGHVWFRLALAAGARRAEVLALRWSNIDMRSGLVTFDASLTRTRQRKTTKTDKERTLSLDDDTMALLSAWKVAQRERALGLGVGMVRNPCVLSNFLDGSVPWAPNSATQRWRRLAIRAGMFEERPHPTTGKMRKVVTVKLHDLRHANASMMLSSGVAPAVASDRLGNSQAVMLRTYSHSLPGADKQAAETLGRLLVH